MMKKTLIALAMMAFSGATSAQFLIGGVGAVSMSNASTSGVSVAGGGAGLAGSTSQAQASNLSGVGVQPGPTLVSQSTSQASQSNLSGALGNAAAGATANSSASGGAGLVVVGGFF